MAKRMTEQQREVSRREFFRRAACAAVGMTATYCTIRDLRLINSAVADAPAGDYKALICLFLFGGNDSNNMLVPTDSSSYAAYAAARVGLAIPQGSLIPLNPLSNDGHTYGLHPEMVELAQHFNTTGKVAFIANVGTLVFPITRTQYLANPRIIPVPPDLFSHNDQVVQWQTSIPDQNSRTGWGGRVADKITELSMNSSTAVSMSISLSGINTFEVGNVVNEYNCTTSGPIGLTNSASSLNMTGINNVLTGFTTAGTQTFGINDIAIQPAAPSAPQANLYEKANSTAIKRSRDNFDAVNTAITPTASSTYFKVPGSSPAKDVFQFYYPRGSTTATGSSLMNQLKMVARMIAGRKTLGHRRQTFFVAVGGYDLHDSLVTVTNATTGTTNPLTGSHAKLYSEISQSLGAFQTAIDQLRTDSNPQIQLAAGDNVTIFTASDFGRTFPMNGTFGADHGWGSHHIVMGDGVNGRRIYGTFPTLAVNGPDDTQIGRWIPKTSVDEYSATLAKWFGVPTGSLNIMFPNLSRFPNPDLGFMAAAAPASPTPSSEVLVVAAADTTAASTSTVSITTSTSSKPSGKPAPAKAPPKPEPVKRPMMRKN